MASETKSMWTPAQLAAFAFESSQIRMDNDPSLSYEESLAPVSARDHAANGGAR